jgi:hypothetical protein
LVFTDDVNILGGIIHTIKKTDALVAATKEIGLEVNADKTKYMVMSGDQNAGQSHRMKTIIVPSERVEEFKYLGATITNQNSIQEESENRLKSGNACNHLMQNLLYGCETWLLTSREECRLRVFENRVLRRIFRPRRDEVTGELRKLRNEALNDTYSSPNINQVIKSRRMTWAGHVACGTLYASLLEGHPGEERCIQSFGGEPEVQTNFV